MMKHGGKKSSHHSGISKLKPLFILCILLLGFQESKSQPFISDPDISDPTIHFLNDSIVVVRYDSIYDVHMRWDGQGSLSSTSLGRYDNHRIVSDLMTVLDVREYHFVPLYADDDLVFGTEENNHRMPGWIHYGQGNGRSPKNIGRDNNVSGVLEPLHSEWGQIRSMSHMNNVWQLRRETSIPNYGLTPTLFHEIGHHGSAYFFNSPSAPLGWTPLEWEPWMPPLVLVNGGNHWWSPGSNRWVNPIHAGLLTSAPSSPYYNWIDLYALGILSWEQISDSVSYVRDPKTLDEYPIYRENLVKMLDAYQNYYDSTPPDQIPFYLQGDDYMEGNGIRIPNGDSIMLDLKTLIVVILGAESTFDSTDIHYTMRLAQETPPDWEIATHGYSQMSTQITHKRANPIEKEMNAEDSILYFQLSDFQSAYNQYDFNPLSGIRFAILPSNGTLWFNELPVTADQVINISEITNNQLFYEKDSEISSDEFVWNAQFSDDGSGKSRWAAPAPITISQSILIMPPMTKVEETLSLSHKIHDLQIYPNPFSDELTVNILNEETSYVTIKVFDLSGKLQYSRAIDGLEVGIHQIQLSDIPQRILGVLNLEISINSEVTNHKLVRTR